MDRATINERRRRAERYRLRRHDLLIDVGVALFLALLLVAFGPGLGMLALIAIAVVLAFVVAPRLYRLARKLRRRI